MGLPKWIYRKVEGVLHHRHEMAMRVRQWYEVAERQYPYDACLSRPAYDEISVGHGQARRSDPTAVTVQHRIVPPPDIEEDERWLHVIEGTLSLLSEQPDKIRFIDTYYDGRKERRGKKMQRACSVACISVPTGYVWKDDIVTITAFNAACNGLINIWEIRGEQAKDGTNTSQSNQGKMSRL